MDFLRLKKHLLMCRLAADSTALIDKIPPGFSGKLTEFRELIKPLLAEDNRKIIVFSEWTGMLNLVEGVLSEFDVKWERLDGSIPQAKRREIIHSFTENQDVRLFLSTNAGSTGLNLQAADTVINLDLPWNPAILEQRIGRAHRMGQTSPVQVYLLVTADTIEERLLDLLGAKSALALATLDLDSDVDFIEMSAGVDELKNRLEILLGRRPDRPLEEPPADPVTDTAAKEVSAERRQRVSAAGGRLFEAVLSFLDEIAPPPQSDSDNGQPPENGQGQFPARPPAGRKVMDFINDLVDHDEEGRPRLTLPLPDSGVVSRIADTLSRLFGG
jgi:superfamily II DNA/RNA helicase